MSLPLLKGEKPLSKIKYVLGIAAGKGGVGKSTVTVNLAQALKKLGLRVGVMDADLYGPSIRKMMPEEVLPRQEGEILIPAISSGIKTISMAYFSKEQGAVIIRAPIANGLINQFVNNVAWGELDILLIDFPPGTGDIQLTLSQKAQLNGALMVTTPQEISVMDVRKAVYLFDQVKVPIIGIVENMSFFENSKTKEKIYFFGQGGGLKLAQEIGVPLLGNIPLDPEICKNCDEGQTSVMNSFAEIAEKLIIELENVKHRNEPPEILIVQPSILSIRWKTGQEQQVQVCDIQKKCGCANCIDEISGKRLLDPSSVRPDVGLISMKKIGRYGMQFQFTSGCSTGIYSYEILRSLG